MQPEHGLHAQAGDVLAARLDDLSTDAQEGPAAFRAKRPPVWTGR
jgi:hypothetical protein